MNRIAVLHDGTEGDVIRTFRKGRNDPNDETTYEIRLDPVTGDRPTGLERTRIVNRSDIAYFMRLKNWRGQRG
jgi:hypothetical protein